MKKTAVILGFLSLLLNSCNQNKPATANIPVVGEAIDSAAIAQDTLQQKSIEQSYEYAQTVVVNPKLVYDIRAYGGPASHGEYAILRRGADNKPDTVVMAERFGIIVSTFTADLNSNGKEEIYIVTRNPTPGAFSFVSGFEFDENGVAKSLDFGDAKNSITVNSTVHYNCYTTKSDSVFAFNKLLIKYYYCGKDRASDLPGHSWQLKGNKFAIQPN